MRFTISCILLCLAHLHLAQNLNSGYQLPVEIAKEENAQNQIELIDEFIFGLSHPDSIINYGAIMYQKSKTFSRRFEIISLMHQGDGYRLKGEYDEAFTKYFNALQIKTEAKVNAVISIKCAIADTYSLIENYSSASKYYHECLKDLEDDQNNESYATALFNLGNNYLLSENIDSAEYFNSRALSYFEAQKYLAGIAYCYGNRGLIWAQKGKFERAEESLRQAIEILESLNFPDAIVEFQLGLTDIFLEKDEPLLALDLALEARYTANTGGFTEQIALSTLKLAEIYERLNEAGEAFSYMKQYMLLKDSYKNSTVVQRMEQIRIAYEQENERSKKRSIKSQSIDFIQDQPRYYAVLIGVNDYQYNDDIITDLEEPHKNVDSLFKQLTTKYQFDDKHTLVLKDANRADIINVFEMLSNTLTIRDNVLIFYAGHGTYDEKLSVGYWLPNDANSGSRANWVSNSVIRDYIGGFSSRHTLLISDACFSGSIFKTRALNNENIDEFAFSKLYKLNSRKAMTSGNLNTVPDKSIFMNFMIKRIRENQEDFISARQLFNQIETGVINNTGNIPQYGTIQNAGDEGGEFIFINKNKF